MVRVTVVCGDERREFSARAGENIKEFLTSHGFFLPSFCGGRGTCGKCRVDVTEGGTTKTVLACQSTLSGDCTVTLSARSEAAFASVGRTLAGFSPRAGLGAAVDLGTTTVAVSLFDLSDGSLLGRTGAWNAQGAFGADVISRISYSLENADGTKILSGAIRAQTRELLDTLCRDNGRSFAELSEITLAGNTVMEHLFCGLSPEGMAAAPFVPQTLFDKPQNAKLDGVPVFVFPCASAFVGGDILAGLWGLGLHQSEECALFLDVGTNGEMALGGKGGFTACSAASGPAFEGAGLSCGMPAAAGAVDRVWIENGKIAFHVLGGGDAKGLCGSGLLDLAACLLDLGVLSESGRLAEPYHLTEDVFLTQEDVRALQLAKAAVAAGIGMLCRERAPEKVYLAGGFGSFLSPESAVRIGMLPEAFLHKTVRVGNAALAGAERALLTPEERRALYEIPVHTLPLSGNREFAEEYIGKMQF